MDRIKKVSREVKEAIQRKSAYTLPNNPTEAGWKPEAIRRAFWQPIIDSVNSAIPEIDRVVGEINAYLNFAIKELDSVSEIIGIYHHTPTGLVLTLSEEGFSIVGYQGEETNIIIPAYVYHENKYIKVVSIENEAFTLDSIESVEIPETVVSIGDRAFNACVNLEKVTLHGEVDIGLLVFGSIYTNYYVPKEYLQYYQVALVSYVSSVDRQIVGVDTIKNNAKSIETIFADLKSLLNQVSSMQDNLSVLNLQVQKMVAYGNEAIEVTPATSLLDTDTESLFISTQIECAITGESLKTY